MKKKDITISEKQLLKKARKKRNEQIRKEYDSMSRKYKDDYIYTLLLNRYCLTRSTIYLIISKSGYYADK